MNLTYGLERCRTFINTQMQPAGKGLTSAEDGRRRRAVTISRQTGSGAHTVAEKLAALPAGPYPQRRPPVDGL